MTRAGTPPVPARLGRWLAAGLIVALIGCGSRPTTAPTLTAGKAADPADEIADTVRDELRKSADQQTARRLVDQLNNYLARAAADRRPAPLSAAERSLLQSDFTLRPEEVAEVGRAEFTPVDSYYLDETLLFRDIARSLDVDQLPPVDRGRAAVAWVARNLRLTDPTGPAAPTGFAAIRGTGTSVERAYVLHALLRQLGLDAALVGDGGGPETVWAVGVLADGQVHLFDARLGLPLPGPDGNGILTLTQARSVADPFKPLALDPKAPYDVTADRAKKAELLVTAPLSALAPRMRFLQGLLPEGTARLTADPVGERDRFRKAVAGPDAPPVKLWCPPVVDALPRLLFAFLPAAEGGGDAAPPGRRRLERYYAERIPFDLLPPFLRDLHGEPRNQVQAAFIGRVTLLSQPGQARDLILRGRFREATDQLVAVQ
ncbi:MAG TPA: hypothetical protein VGF55_13730, partial [Gemmataceae bacterium]